MNSKESELNIKSSYCYQAEMKELFIRAKLRGDITAAKQLIYQSLYVSQRWIEEMSWDYIIPIPPHYIRSGKRGFHLPYLLGDAISRRARGTPLTRTERRMLKLRNPFWGTEQKKLSREMRLINVRKNLVFRGNQVSLQDQSVLLVDDVITTGATLSVAQKLIEDRKPARIEAFTIAYVLRS